MRKLSKSPKQSSDTCQPRLLKPVPARDNVSFASLPEMVTFLIAGAPVLAPPPQACRENQHGEKTLHQPSLGTPHPRPDALDRRHCLPERTPLNDAFGGNDYQPASCLRSVDRGGRPHLITRRGCSDTTASKEPRVAGSYLRRVRLRLRAVPDCRRFSCHRRHHLRCHHRCHRLDLRPRSASGCPEWKACRRPTEQGKPRLQLVACALSSYAAAVERGAIFSISAALTSQPPHRLTSADVDGRRE
jgi:hypothetical protein